MSPAGSRRRIERLPRSLVAGLRGIPILQFHSYTGMYTGGLASSLDMSRDMLPCPRPCSRIHTRPPASIAC